MSGDLIVWNCFNLKDVTGINDVHDHGSAGGIFGYVGPASGDYKTNVLKVENSYNIGSVTAGGNAGGIGGVARYQSVEFTYCYNISNSLDSNIDNGGILAHIGEEFIEVQHNISNCYNIDTSLFGTDETKKSTVSNTGLINTDGTFPNGTPYTDLLTALNAWVDANKATYPELKNWVMGSNGYPTFAE